MDEPKPWFVKVTGPMQWQIKPYGWPGWALTGIWTLLFSGIMSLLLLESVRERWWIVLLLGIATAIPLLVVSIQVAVPIEEVRAAEQRRRRRGRPKRGG